MQDLKLALVQSYLHWEDKPANLAMLDQKLSKIEEVPDVIVLPEMFTTGFSMNTASLAENMQGEGMKWLAQTAIKMEAIICGSLIIEENGNFYNRLIWMQPDGTYKSYDKRHLFSMAGEEKVYTPGKEKLIVEHKGWKICPMICYDLRFPAWTRNIEGYDLLLFVANWPERRIQHWRKLLQARAIENQAYVAGVNRYGNDGNDVYHSGNSMAVDSQGEILTEIEEGDEIRIVTLNYEAILKTRRYMPFLKDMDSFRIIV